MINNRVRGTIAAAVIATSVAATIAAAGVARADTVVARDPAPIHVRPARQPADAPPGHRTPDARASVGARPYVVLEGDSYWKVAERFLPDDAVERDVWRRAEELIAANAPRLGYDDPAMIHPGDPIHIPSSTATQLRALGDVSPQRALHHVTSGDSYWAIAESVVGADATAAEVLAKTELLIELNSTRLGYDDPQMLHPGDVVYLSAPVVTPAAVVTRRATQPAPELAQRPEARPARKPDALPAATPTQRQVARAQTPDSPPLSELAIIATSRGAHAQVSEAGADEVLAEATHSNPRTS